MVQPGKVTALTLLLSLDILWAFRCLRMESPAIMMVREGLFSSLCSELMPFCSVSTVLWRGIGAVPFEFFFPVRLNLDFSS